MILKSNNTHSSLLSCKGSAPQKGFALHQCSTAEPAIGALPPITAASFCQGTYKKKFTQMSSCRRTTPPALSPNPRQGGFWPPPALNTYMPHSSTHLYLPLAVQELETSASTTTAKIPTRATAPRLGAHHSHPTQGHRKAPPKAETNSSSGT